MRGQRFYDRDYLRRKRMESTTVEEDHKYLDELFVDEYGEAGSPLDKIEIWGQEHGGWTSKHAMKDLERRTKGVLDKDQRVHMVEHVNSGLARELELEQVKLKTGQTVYRNKAGRFSSLQLSDEQRRAQRAVEE